MKNNRKNPIGVRQRTRRKDLSDFAQARRSNPSRFNRTSGNKIINQIDDDLQFLDISSNDDANHQDKVKSKAKLTRRQKRRLKKEQRLNNQGKFRRYTKRFIMVFGGLLIAYVGYVGVEAFLSINRVVVDRNGAGAPALQENVDPTSLRGEGDGRVNILLIGVGGDGHDGGDLADTIIVASLDPITNELAMLSVPRDLYVAVPGYWSTRINAAHAIGIDQQHKGGGVALLTETIEETLDIPIHYFIRVDFDGFIQAVDSVGGITIDVPEAVYDTNFWWQYGILDVPAGIQEFDGERALYFARSRYTSSRGDFSRNERQRAMIIALKDKALSLGTFSDPRKLIGLIKTAGNHVRTDLQLSEMGRLYSIISETSANAIKSSGLDDSTDNYLTTSTIDGASVLVPKSGDFKEIQKYLRKLFIDGFIRSEAAPVKVVSSAQKNQARKAQVGVLKSYGYKVTNGGVVDSSVTETTLYDLSEGQSPYTKRYLEQRYNTSMKSADELPAGIDATSGFVLIVGTNGQ